MTRTQLIQHTAPTMTADIVVIVSMSVSTIHGAMSVHGGQITMEAGA